MENQDIDINNQIEHIQQTGGFVQSIPGALMSVLRAIIGVFKFIFKLILFIIRTLYPYIIKYLGFCVIVSILLTLFGFFGIFFTFCAIFLIYYKLFKKIKAGNLKFAEEYHKKVSKQSDSEKSGLIGKVAKNTAAFMITGDVTELANTGKISKSKSKSKGEKAKDLIGIQNPGTPVKNI